ncbi:molybdopterin converting factor subunit 1 [Aquibacillus sp. 3ASR75-11]|uniref:Molybdopterin synthase sulfur carrier subunit n=1 Tax=Terrihalobacillus insolitus TaxID=2950438 RepID=A0A9X4AMP8_9BACI|nr:molybdopterin converting factor subunit 1 [Terrihalobacillus insolitus]MDC3413702.1 molybdopterin converting factor subunit 1 [Terrihalobacillus insolitus]MDC3425561.1 molybdopterin converting factor subunit 1 [Terrihalobacillus insolitus]
MIHVLLFAQLQEAVGKDSLELQFTSITVSDLKQMLKEEYNVLSIDQAMTAINEEYAQGDTVIRDGDTVAFIPPVSGG